MAELTLNREFDADIETVFAYISQREHLSEWWGPEGMTVPDNTLDFTKTGPWYSVMENDDGMKRKVSGQVTHVNPPNSVGFTWAWHDENDARGDESHVTLSLISTANGGTAFSLRHKELVSEEAAAAHNGGWESSLRKLQRLAA